MVDAKKKWQNELDNQIMQIDRGVELAMTEALDGWNDPKFPKAKYYEATKAIESFAKALGKEKTTKDAIYGVLNSMSMRISKKYGKN